MRIRLIDSFRKAKEISPQCLYSVINTAEGLFSIRLCEHLTHFLVVLYSVHVLVHGYVYRSAVYVYDPWSSAFYLFSSVFNLQPSILFLQPSAFYLLPFFFSLQPSAFYLL